jgi:hypothetical protein
LADSGTRQPEVSSDTIRQELADLREQVQTLRSELAALKSTLAAVQATTHSENRAVSAPLQESSKDLMPLLENVRPPSEHGQEGTAAPTHSSSSLAGAHGSRPTAKLAQGQPADLSRCSRPLDRRRARGHELRVLM